MSDTEIRMMRYTIEQLSSELQATRQYVSDIKTDLERTRKALDVAVDALKTIKYRNETYNRDDSPDCIDATLALEQITALEQKDVK